MNENESTMLTPDLPQPQKRRKKPIWFWIVITACAVAFTVLAVGAGFLINYISNQPTPLEKTLNAVFPSTELIGQMLEEGGSVTLEGSLGKDIEERYKKDPLDIEVELAFRDRLGKLTLGYGSGGTMVDASILMDQKGVQLSSEALFDETYQIKYKGLQKAIDGSVFAPDSGTEYAMSVGEYESLLRFLSAIENAEDSKEILTDSAEVIYKDLYPELEITKEAKYVELTDYEALAKVTEIKFDETFVTAFVDAILKEWKDNGELRATVVELAVLSGSFYGNEAAFDADLKAKLDELKDSVKNTEFDCCIRMAERLGYLVAFEIEVDSKERVSGRVVNPKKTELSLLFSENPGNNPEFEFTLKVTEGKVCTTDISATYRRTEKNGTTEKFEMLINGEEEGIKTSLRVTANASVRESGAMSLDVTGAIAAGFDKLKDAEYTDFVDLEITGTYEQTENTLTASIEKLSLFVEDERIAKLDTSRFSLTLSAEKPKIKKAWFAKNYTKMSEDDLVELDETVNQSMKSLAKEINDAIGFSYMKHEWTAEDAASLDLANAPYAYDVTTDRLYVRRSNIKGTPTRTVLVFDAHSMVYLDCFAVNTDCDMMSADNGQLAVAAGDSKKIVIYNTETHAEVKTLTMDAPPVAILLDGDVLLSADTSSLNHTVISSGKTKQLQRLIKAYAMTVEHESHVACVAHAEGILLLNTKTGEVVKETNLASTTPFYNGKAFRLGKSYYNVEGSAIKLQSMTLDRKHDYYEVKDVLYAGKDFCILYEENVDMMAGYFIYRKGSGAPIDTVDMFLCREVIPLSDDTFLLCGIDDEALSFRVITLTEDWVTDGE